MKFVFTFALVLLAVALKGETVPEKVVRSAIPGSYCRSYGGLVFFTVTLRADGSYFFSESDCFTRSKSSGKWIIQNDIIILDHEEAGFRRFRIRVVPESKAYSLLPLEVTESEKNQSEQERLFLHVEKRG